MEHCVLLVGMLASKKNDCMQDAMSCAFSNGTGLLMGKEASGGATEAFGYAKAIIVLIVLYLAWEQGVMLASRWVLNLYNGKFSS